MCFFCIFAAHFENISPMNNKNTLIGFILIAAILFGWMYFMSPSKEQLAEQQRIQDSIRQARMEQMVLDSIRLAERQAEQKAAMLADSLSFEWLPGFEDPNLIDYLKD